jgi:hypothetical protein
MEFPALLILSSRNRHFSKYLAWSDFVGDFANCQWCSVLKNDVSKIYLLLPVMLFLNGLPDMQDYR